MGQPTQQPRFEDEPKNNIAEWPGALEALPEGYRLLNFYETMAAADLYWTHRGQWSEVDVCPDVGYPFGPSYRPMARKLKEGETKQFKVKFLGASSEFPMNQLSGLKTTKTEEMGATRLPDWEKPNYPDRLPPIPIPPSLKHPRAQVDPN